MALHVCGYIDPIVADIVETGISLLSLDAPSSLEKLVDLSAAQLIVMGNVATVLFSSGTREEMEHAIRDCIEKAAEGSGYILSSGCEIPFDSTEDRIEHYFNYARQYSRQFMSNLEERRPELFQD
jgi:uroporphyrinogen decarboxylase